jgi:hypothetical protein
MLDDFAQIAFQNILYLADVFVVVFFRLQGLAGAFAIA